MKINAQMKKMLILTAVFLFMVTMTGCRVATDTDGAIKLIYPETTFAETMASENWFNALLVWPMAQFINKLTPKMGSVGALAALTLLVNAVLLVVTLKSQIQQQQMQLLQPELERIQRKYEGRTDDASRQKQAQEMNKLYQKYNVNPLSTIAMTFLQFPIVIALFHAVQRSSLLKSTPFMGLSLEVSPLNGMKAGIPGYFIIFLVMIVSQAITMFMPRWMAKKRAQEEAERTHRRVQESKASTQSNMMMIYMVILFSVIGLTLPSAMSIYWTIYSVVNIVKMFVVQSIITKQGA
ncbi:MAG: membrane protein insertase YidC [Solobacterium sp.]|nr:membrane protein insertase YidC [Solobacterium sp.]MBQ1445891.1 membrane protein insertase YidC [Solobacterium sp.]